MTLTTKKFKSLPKLMRDLEALALGNDDYVFRGHAEVKYKIGTTYSRYTTIPFQSWDTCIDEMLSLFLSKVVTHQTLPFDVKNRRARLEFGRHHAVPTPVIDFSHSPYVALYFALAGYQYRHEKRAPNAAVYALNIKNLALCFSKLFSTGVEIMENYGKFMYESEDYFDVGYRAGELKYVGSCASWNSRMRNQMGCFIYDTLDYREGMMGGGNFEDWVATLKEPASEDGKIEPILTKFIVPKSVTKEVFQRLDLMNISGASLLDRDGFATDVVNTYNYTSKIGEMWDLTMRPPNNRS